MKFSMKTKALVVTIIAFSFLALICSVAFAAPPTSFPGQGSKPAFPGNPPAGEQPGKQPGWVEPYASAATGKLNISKEVVSPGNVNKMEGNGFRRGAKLAVMFDGKVIGYVVAWKNGFVRYNGRIPSAKAGIHTITITGEAHPRGTLTLKANVTVKANDKLNLSKAIVKQGNKIKTSGNGFRRGAKCTVSLDGKPIGHVVARRNGNVIYNLKVPKTKVGRHTITITGEAHPRGTYTLKTTVWVK